MPTARGATSRRGLLLAGLSGPTLVVLAGCTLRIGQPDDAVAAPPPSADAIARSEAAAGARALAASARTTARLRPDLARPLARIAQEHDAHARALLPHQGADATAATAPTPTSSASGPPPTRASALTSQRRAEQAARAAVEADLARVSGDAARLLASIAACRAAHIAQLARLARVAMPTGAGS